MDKLDQKLYTDLNIQIEIPDKLDAVIRNALNKKKTHNSIFKKVASFLIIAFATTGIVFAAGVAYENYEKNIWKAPQKVTGENADNNDNQNIAKQNTMSEDEARKKGQDILEKFGYGNDKIKTIKLEGNPENYDLTWYIETEQNILVDFNANGEETFSITNNNTLSNDKTNYRTTKGEAEKTAKELAKKYGYDIECYNYVEVNSNLVPDSDSFVWDVAFFKEYDGVKNPYERIEVSFIPQINEIICFTVINKKFENNPIEITEETAKEIALKEEQKNTQKYEIKNIETKLKINSMNGYAYFRTNDYDQLHKQTSSSDYPYEKSVFYRTEARIRKVWLVTIVYNIPNKFNGNYNPNDERVSYFVDATTGEVIGGGSIY